MSGIKVSIKIVTLVKQSITMSNSFYYFFSATPQVLAAILALFGVFVIFKIQTMKSELLSIGQAFFDYIKHSIGPDSMRKDDDENRKIKNKIRIDVYKCLQSKDINELKLIIDKITNVDILQDGDFKIYKKRYVETHTKLRKLIDETIQSSKFTAFIIILCLATIPLGDLIIKHMYILYTLFIVVIICIFICFYKLILILKRALIDS